MEVNRPAPKAGDEEEEDEDAVNGVKAGVMITADGGFVVARPDRFALLTRYLRGGGVLTLFTPPQRILARAPADHREHVRERHPEPRADRP